MTQPTQARRRFAPVPIETTFKEHRRGGPAAEPTPEPSPVSESAPESEPVAAPVVALSMPKVADHQTQTVVTREKRRFAPQLLESTRRSRRAGDTGPATRPADKTDILPYSKHIYSLSSKKKQQLQRRPGHARRESCDDEIAEHVFDLNKLDAQRHWEVAMLAFPNSTTRLGGAEHFFLREGSDDDESPRGRVKARGAGAKDERRDSSGDNVNWMVKEMQKHADQLAAERGDLDFDDSLDSVSARSEGPPDNTFAFTNKARHTLRGSLGPLSPIGEDAKALSRSDEESSYFAKPVGAPSTAGNESVDVDMPDAQSCLHVAPVSQLPPETNSTRPRGAFGRFYGYQNQQPQDKAAEKALFRLRSQKSPPMAGKDLTFRMCPSPKQTKLESDQKWDIAAGANVEANRDATGQQGLWRGYCFTNNAETEAMVPSPRPAPMIMTPMTPSTPFEDGDPFAVTGGTLAPFPISAEPTPVASTHSSVHVSNAEHRTRAGQPKGLHMLMGLEQRLHQEKAAAELEERIAAEFTDHFVTQVYNYLSLGYPATARAYDEELAKISRFSTAELEKEDDAVMGGIGSRAKGHIKLSMELDMVEERRCPRWKALKKYIFEWARQHPDLDSIDPLAWGVAERRGSWGI